MCHSSVATINNNAGLHSQLCGLGTKLDDEHNHTHMKFHNETSCEYNMLASVQVRVIHLLLRVLSSLTCERLARFITFLVSGTVLLTWNLMFDT